MRRNAFWAAWSDIKRGKEPAAKPLASDEIRDLACCDKFVRESASEFCARCGYTNLDHLRKRSAQNGGIKSVMKFADVLEQAFDDLGYNDHNMERSRPYTGQPHTDTGERGRTEVKGITFRDLRDCMVRAFFLAAGHIDYARYQEATKGEMAALCDNDLFELDLNQLDPVAVIQNFTCEVERIMGIFPNVPELKYVGPPESEKGDV